jgi:hypothetical protein
METNWAAENLQTIRTLMERSALYRRALAPVMIFAGAMGIMAAAGGVVLRVESEPSFIGYWLGVAVAGLVGAFFLVRRQALKSAEAFWSPPTRRVATALLPCLSAGLFTGIWFLVMCSEPQVGDPPTGMGDDRGAMIWLSAIWAIFYGCALHAAGFFTSRGLRLFGWLFIASGVGVLFWALTTHRQDYPDATWQTCHWLMGLVFGVLHLAYGIYLYFTEQRKNAA